MGMWFAAPRRFPHLFLACFPKSGSTFLTKALQGLTGYPQYYLTEEGGNNEQDISRRKLRKARQASVIQQHAKATLANVDILRKFGVRPIVLVRNLFDVVVSVRDHMYQESHFGPTGYVHREFWRLEESQQFDYLIQIHLPWYFNFLVSWHEARNEISLITTSYEELFTDPVATLRRLAKFYGLDAGDAAIRRALEYAAGQDTRLNKGIVGRGQQLLTAAQCDAIRRMAKVWHVDRGIMRSIGIDLDQSIADADMPAAPAARLGTAGAMENPARNDVNLSPGELRSRVA